MRKLIVFIVVCAVSLVFLNIRDGVSGKGQKIAVYPPQITGKYIDSMKGARKVVLIYASWCPYCRQKMPDLMKLEMTKAGSVIAVSVDQDSSRFAKYIQSLDDIPFKVILNKGAEVGLQMILEKYGAQPWKGYPTMILLDEHNKVVRQGNLSVQQVSMYVLTGAIAE